MEQQQKNAPPELRNVVNFLRNKAGLKVRYGVLNGRRAEYFKGKGAIKALLSPAYSKLRSVPPVTSEEDAVKLLHSIIPFAFYLRVERGSPSGGKGSPRPLQITQQQLFTPDEYYIWFYEGSQLRLILGSIGMVAVILAAVMFPLWPSTLRLGVWYLSIGVLALIGLFFAIAIIRLIFYVITLVVASPGIWIFPKLFDDVGFVESFIPLYAWDIPVKKGKKKKAASTKGSKGATEARDDDSADASGSAAKAEPSGASTAVPDIDHSEMTKRATVEEIADDDD